MEDIASSWTFRQIVPCHLAAPVPAGPDDLRCPPPLSRPGSLLCPHGGNLWSHVSGIAQPWPCRGDRACLGGSAGPCTAHALVATCRGAPASHMTPAPLTTAVPLAPRLCMLPDAFRSLQPSRLQVTDRCQRCLTLRSSAVLASVVLDKQICVRRTQLAAIATDQHVYRQLGADSNKQQVATCAVSSAVVRGVVLTIVRGPQAGLCVGLQAVRATGAAAEGAAHRACAPQPLPRPTAGQRLGAAEQAGPLLPRFVRRVTRICAHPAQSGCSGSAVSLCVGSTAFLAMTLCVSARQRGISGFRRLKCAPLLPEALQRRPCLLPPSRTTTNQ